MSTFPKMSVGSAISSVIDSAKMKLFFSIPYTEENRELLFSAIIKSIKTSKHKEMVRDYLTDERHFKFMQNGTLFPILLMIKDGIASIKVGKDTITIDSTVPTWDDDTDLEINADTTIGYSEKVPFDCAMFVQAADTVEVVYSGSLFYSVLDTLYAVSNESFMEELNTALSECESLSHFVQLEKDSEDRPVFRFICQPDIQPTPMHYTKHGRTYKDGTPVIKHAQYLIHYTEKHTVTLDYSVDRSAGDNPIVRCEKVIHIEKQPEGI